MRVVEAVDRFLIAIRADGVKPSTVKWYSVRFQRFLDTHGQVGIDEIDLDKVREYIAEIRDEELSAHYLYALVRVIRRLFKWLYEERKIDNPFYRRMMLPKLPQSAPKAVSMGDVVKLLKACKDDAAGVRSKAIIYFLLDTGCRVGGLCSLTIGNLFLAEGRALITEKGDKTRVVIFQGTTSRVVENWLSMRPYKSSEWVFTSLKENRPMNPNSVIQMLRRLKKKAGVNGRVNPHSFRHAFAREFILNGGDLASASQIMGHSQLAVTKQFYAVFRIEELRSKHEAFSPVSYLDLEG
jgi:site-specific recombinase XerD